jgi:hypothetical protein
MRLFQAIVTFFRVLFGRVTGDTALLAKVPPSDRAGSLKSPLAFEVMSRSGDTYNIAIASLDAQSGYSVGWSPTAARTYTNIAGMAASIIRGNMGAIKTTTINGYSASRGIFGIAQTPSDIYVYHLEHATSDLITVGSLTTTLQISSNGYFRFTPGGVLVGGFNAISDTSGLPAEIRDVVRELRKLV